MRHRDFGMHVSDEDRATPRYTLFSPLHGRSTFLINLRGEGCMYGDCIHEIDPAGMRAWEWHACRDMVVENYPISPSQHRDEFAHANAISPLPNGDILISFRRLNTIGLIDRRNRKMKWEH